MAGQSLLYDPRFHTFQSWACLMVEQYAGQQLQIPNDDTDWKDWGDGLFNIGLFANEGTPRPREFENWEDWVAAMIGSINAGV